MAHRSGLPLLWRIDDLDRVREGAAESQLADAQRLGINVLMPPVRQSERTHDYAQAVDGLATRGLVYECYCSRRDIQQAPTAPHAPPGAYPGTCRGLSDAERSRRRALLAEQGREPALRLVSDNSEHTAHDIFLGTIRSTVDDFVLRRGDGVWAYNLTSVVDDADLHVVQAVRGADLATSTPRQVYLAELLGVASPDWGHVPLVLNDRGERLAKRDGAVTLSQLCAHHFDVWAWLGMSISGVPWTSLADGVNRFDPSALSPDPVVFTPPDARG